MGQLHYVSALLGGGMRGFGGPGESLGQPTALSRGGRRTVRAPAAVDMRPGRLEVRQPEDGADVASRHPVLAGTATEGATVTAYDEGYRAIGQVTAERRSWSLRVAPELSEGRHAIFVMQHKGDRCIDTATVTFTIQPDAKVSVPAER